MADQRPVVGSKPYSCSQEDMRGVVGPKGEGCITFRNSVGWYWLIYFTPEIGCFTKQDMQRSTVVWWKNHTGSGKLCPNPQPANPCVAVLWNRHRDCMTTRPAVLVLLPTLPGRPFHQQHEASLWWRTASRTMPPSARVLMAGSWADCQLQKLGYGAPNGG